MRFKYARSIPFVCFAAMIILDSPGSVTAAELGYVIPGSGPVSFADAGSPQTIASFTSEGLYTLGLTADDGELIAESDAVVAVNPAEPKASACSVTPIMPVGDSITLGSSSGVNDPTLMVGYRKFLWDFGVNANYLMDFVGPAINGQAIFGFDPHHDGEGGVRPVDVAVRIYDRLVTFRPSIILLHIGTNGLTESIDDVRLILDEIDRYEIMFQDSVFVVVAQIIQRDLFNSTIATFNQNLGQLVSARLASGDQLLLVDMANALTYPDDMFDSLHPNSSGYLKMAQVWIGALDSLLQPCNDVTPPSVPLDLQASLNGTSGVDLSWSSSVDAESGVVGYRIFRDGLEIGTSIGTYLSDSGVLPQTTYTYRVLAFDAMGNESLQSHPAVIFTSEINTAISINVGGGEYIDANGHLWVADFGFNTGNLTTTTTTVQGTSDPGLYQTGRWDASGGQEMEYRIPVADGNYLVTLHFAETYHRINLAGERVFDVHMEDALVFDNLDIFAEAGFATALMKSSSVIVADGELSLRFTHEVENPAIRAIEIYRTGDIAPDTIAPTKPTGLIGTPVGSMQLDLSWNESTDEGVGVAGYRVFRDGIELASVVASTYTDLTVEPEGIYLYSVEAFDFMSNVSEMSEVIVVTMPEPDTAISINVGGGEYIDANGHLWVADFGFNTGNLTTTTTTVQGTSDPGLYQTGRWDASGGQEMEYRIPVADGNYLVTLHFAETYHRINLAGERVFDVHMEDALVFDNLDIFAEAGFATALMKSSSVIVADGELSLRFTHEVENPAIRAIEIYRTGDIAPDTIAPTKPTGLIGTPVGSMQLDLSWNESTDEGVGVAGYRVFRDGIELASVVASTYTDLTVEPEGIYLYSVEAFDFMSNVSEMSEVIVVTMPEPDTAISINVGGGEYIDANGHLWVADFGFNTGNLTTTTTTVQGTSDPGLYQTGRWDASGGQEMEYRIPVADGNYLVTLHFAETYHRINLAGERVFDVHMEDALVFDNLDIFAEAGFATALMKSSSVIVADGELSLRFTHEVENPAIRAIEIVLQ